MNDDQHAWFIAIAGSFIMCAVIFSIGVSVSEFY